LSYAAIAVVQRGVVVLLGLGRRMLPMGPAAGILNRTHSN
jgi:hypothetical protein